MVAGSFALGKEGADALKRTDHPAVEGIETTEQKRIVITAPQDDHRAKFKYHTPSAAWRVEKKISIR